MVFNLHERQEHAPPPLSSERKETEELHGGCCVSSCSDSPFDEFVAELCRAFNHLGAESDLIGTVASIGESIDVDTAITCLRDWNDHRDQLQTESPAS